MSETPSARAGERGATHGGPDRAGRPLVSPLLAYDLNREAGQLRQERNWRQYGHDAKTLVKEQGLRLVLVALQAGARLGEHKTPGPVAIHVLKGTIELDGDGRTRAAAAGELLVLEANLLHRVRAASEADLLLTLAGDTFGGPNGA